MFSGGFGSYFRINASNLPGWRTKRHIVVIESDDWGSNRMPSLKAFDNLLKGGMSVDKSHYNLYDSLECNDDLEMLFDVLIKYVDKSNRHPVITGVNVVANPDFEKIKENGFSDYCYEPYTDTCKRYPDHDKVFQLWMEGINKRLIVPVFHGREHLNAQFWMRALRNGNKSTILGFENGVTGIPRKGIDGESVPAFQAAFDIDTVDDLPYLKIVLKTGLDLFEKLYGYRSRYFVPTNGPFNNTLEETLNQCGVHYINTAKRQREPLGEGQFHTNVRYSGNRNRYGQIYLTRNCAFEPSSSGFEKPSNTDWVND